MYLHIVLPCTSLTHALFIHSFKDLLTFAYCRQLSLISSSLCIYSFTPMQYTAGEEFAEPRTYWILPARNSFPSLFMLPCSYSLSPSCFLFYEDPRHMPVLDCNTEHTRLDLASSLCISCLRSVDPLELSFRDMLSIEIQALCKSTVTNLPDSPLLFPRSIHISS